MIDDTTLDGSTLRKVFGQFPSGVVAVCAVADGQPAGMVASTFVPVSLGPPLVAICVMCPSYTWAKLRGAAHLGVSILGEGHAAVARQLSSPSGDRFAGVDILTSPDGAVVLTEAGAWLEVSLQDEITAGDHLIALMRVERAAIAGQVEPLVFHASTFRRLAG